MKRGDVYLADLEPIRGAEANKSRPVILVGNRASLEAASRHGGVVTIVPCSSNTEVRGSMHIVLRPTRSNGLRVPSKAQAEQIRSVDVGRLVQPLGRLGSADLEALEDAIRFHLAV